MKGISRALVPLLLLLLHHHFGASAKKIDFPNFLKLRDTHEATEVPTIKQLSREESLAAEPLLSTVQQQPPAQTAEDKAKQAAAGTLVCVHEVGTCVFTIFAISISGTHVYPRGECVC
eukprot:GHVU01150965.1.p4 GENE.GHVU01150965.1~~GHVU01150965.1.p4  ORF type:complete len:118 (+),score=14.01 GHVU01150965.1:815-1168(+)